MFENADILDCDVFADIEMEKHSTFMKFNFDLTGTATVVCDRCLENLEIELDNIADLYVRFGENVGDETDETVIISPKEYELDVAQYIYEYLVLSLPFRCVHEDDDQGNPTCNPEMMKHISTEEEVPQTDSRWNGLKNIFDNNKQ